MLFFLQYFSEEISSYGEKIINELRSCLMQRRDVCGIFDLAITVNIHNNWVSQYSSVKGNVKSACCTRCCNIVLILLSLREC